MFRLRFVSIALVVIFFRVFAAANNNVDRLILKYVNGESVEILLSGMPVIIFENDEMHLTTSTSSLQCPLDDLQDYSFEGASMGHSDIGIPSLTFKQNGDELIITSCDCIPEIRMFDIQGIEMSIESKIVGESCIVNISNLANGVYILSINGNSFKIMKK